MQGPWVLTNRGGVWAWGRVSSSSSSTLVLFVHRGSPVKSGQPMEENKRVH